MKRLFHLLKDLGAKNGTDPWKLVYDRFKPAQEGLREALCALGNGYFATRGAMSESPASRVCYPGTYCAGVYNTTPTFLAGRTIYNEDMVNCPNWLLLTFRLGTGEWITTGTGKILRYRQELDMRNGVLNRKIRIRDRKGRITLIETQRIVHMQDPHRAAIKYSITAENYDEWIVVRTALDGSVQNTGVARYRQLNTRHLKPVSGGSFDKSGIYLSVRTSNSKIEIAEASKLRVFSAGKELRPAGRVIAIDKKWIARESGFRIRRHHRYDVEKTVSIFTSRDPDTRDPLKAAIASEKAPQRFEDLFRPHKQAWSSLWRICDIKIDGDQFTQKALRLHIFHLLQAASLHNIKIDAGIPARGLHGEAYRGHIFWDEMYALPFFNLHLPRVSRSVLMYRYRRLQEAREYAKENGYRGAMFPWQSGSSGKEETQEIHLNPRSGKWGIDHSRIQRHVSFAIAYNIWQYWKNTGDIDFVIRYGAEMFLSIAQFGADLTEFGPKDKRHHISGVMGPDEFHEKLSGAEKPGFRDNAYTNVFVVWVLMKAFEMLNILPKHDRERLIKELAIDQKDLLHWDDITKKMKVVINNDGIIGQFEGYFGLKELDLEKYRTKYGKIQRMDRILKAEGRSPNDYKIAKQADALVLFYIFSPQELKEIFGRLGYRIDRRMLKKNYEYYVSRTSHGSTLSKVVHCYLAFLLGKSKEAWDWYNEVLRSDIYDTQGGTTPEGVHVGVMGGSVNIALAGFAGITFSEKGIMINPSLPKSWRSLKLKFRYRGTVVEVGVSKRNLTVCIHGPRSKRVDYPVEVQGRPCRFFCETPQRIPLKKVPRLARGEAI
ncbi:MAG: glycosyl hydrolase family 65 protein [Candidatus Omnitrophota bacterium]